MAKAISKAPEKKEPISEVEETLQIMEAIDEPSNPNVVTNKWPRYMSPEQAQRIIDKYGDFTNTEIPNELAQARGVLGIK